VKITPKDKLLSVTRQCSGSDKRLIPHLDTALRLAKSRRSNQTRKEQKPGRTPLTKNPPGKRKVLITSSILPKSVLRRKKAGKFLSLFVTKTKFSKQKKSSPKYQSKRSSDAGKISRLAVERKLRLFESLRKEPLTFIELHRQFGVSKQTLEGLVRNGFLEEVWGKSGVGLKFTITGAGKECLKELEESASYGPKIKRVVGFRLNQQIFP
jgi:hypothetical protein